MLPPQSLIPLALFALLVLAASLYVLAALGQFPRAARNAALVQGLGPAILWATMMLVAACVAAAIAAAWALMPWYAAIIAGGVAILIAPLALQYFSDEFVDGRGALLSFSGIGAVLAAGLLWYMGG